MSAARWLLALALLGGAAAGGYAWWNGKEATPRERYRTQAVDRGEIVQKISASGTVNPVTLVNVGTQVSGTVLKLHADFNAQVKAGQVLAELDPALFQAALNQSEANLASARAELRLAEVKLARTKMLKERNFIAGSELDANLSERDAAAARVKLAEAQVGRDRINLGNSVIRSPIAGVVVARNVDVGQTVAASFQTPTLFQIARDLAEMQIDTAVAEADVGQLRVGQKVNFSVDAYPDREFEGTVRQLRLNPTIQQNVVTYNMVVALRNDGGELMPGMTAHVSVAVARKTGVLRVPNAALRYRPSGDDAAPKGTAVYRPGKEPQPVKLKTGITDGSYTEVLEGEVKEGDKLVIREIANRDKGGGNFRLRLF